MSGLCLAEGRGLLSGCCGWQGLQGPTRGNPHLVCEGRFPLCFSACELHGASGSPAGSPGPALPGQGDRWPAGSCRGRSRKEWKERSLLDEMLGEEGGLALEAVRVGELYLQQARGLERRELGNSSVGGTASAEAQRQVWG